MEIVGSSRAMIRIREEIRRVSRNRRNVLIIGEQGVGKGHIAEAIHSSSKDRKKPCIRLNLAAVDPGRLKKLVELAQVKGEFYNPIAPDHGNFKLVDGTTLILEDLDKSGLSVQSSICELLMYCRRESKELRTIVLLQNPVAESAKNGSVSDCIVEQIKRWDTLTIPPLRERAEDIPELVEYFVKQVGDECGIKDMVIDSNAVGVLVRQEWKENVQELKRLVERSIILSQDKNVFRLPAGLMNEQAELTRILRLIEEGPDFALDNSMEIIEKGLLLRTLDKFEYNQSRAARFLRMTEDTLRYRMRKLGIPTARRQ